jgi:hypothetical protein
MGVCVLCVCVWGLSLQYLPSLTKVCLFLMTQSPKRFDLSPLDPPPSIKYPFLTFSMGVRGIA